MLLVVLVGMSQGCFGVVMLVALDKDFGAFLLISSALFPIRCGLLL
jgi:hypothetical protein